MMSAVHELFSAYKTSKHRTFMLKSACQTAFTIYSNRTAIYDKVLASELRLEFTRNMF